MSGNAADGVNTDPSQPSPFKVNIPDEEVKRMVRLIEDGRLPDEPFTSDVSWDYGVDLKWLKEMRNTWLNDFDWKAVEKEMNKFEHFRVRIEGVNLHYIHQRSSRADAIPILLVHGWPESFWEFNRVIEPLVNPPPDQPAFHVTVPSIPGFGFSSPPPRKGWTVRDSARIFDQLMTGILGYSTYMAQAGDWGSFITRILGTDEFPACKLLNFNLLNGCAPFRAFLTLPLFLLPTSIRQWLYSLIYPKEEIHDLSRTWHFVTTSMGFYMENRTKPSTIGYILYDSPIGLLAWIGDMYEELVDPALFRDRVHDILVTASLYYLSGTAHTAALIYRENTGNFIEKLPMTKPYGLSLFPYDVWNEPVSWTKGKHRKLVFARRHSEGGHFAALEVPDLLVGDLREMASEHWERSL